MADEEMQVEKSEDKKSKPSWIKMKSADLEKIVVELGKKGEMPAKIGLILRDKYGVPKAKLLGKEIVQILKEHGVEYKTEKKNLQNKIEKLKAHFSKHKHDYTSNKSLVKKTWAMHKMEKAVS